MGLSRGAKGGGILRVNNQEMGSNDFGKFGAFVQQDDVLLDSFTPEESFRFAAKLRTKLSNREIEEKIDSVVERLGLKECRKTIIGGVLKKGLSGGERKRTSIGYELITDPNLLLCDEPTSGLDSSTSLRIIRMLKREARRNNLTIICTIHQPSAELFYQFDRLLLLHEGHQIYQGNVRDTTAYLSKNLHLKFGKFTNPADLVLKMTQVPKKCSPDLTVSKLVIAYEQVLEPQVQLEIEGALLSYYHVKTDINKLAKNRYSNFFI
mmetsp:Transcript_416/g.832  ORF Transcript_416/g.832 Transcript_416/m.832 type:complete len:265 (+) Transcript_416:584-1378(+)